MENFVEQALVGVGAGVIIIGVVELIISTVQKFKKKEIENMITYTAYELFIVFVLIPACYLVYYNLYRSKGKRR